MKSDVRRGYLCHFVLFVVRIERLSVEGFRKIAALFYIGEICGRDGI